MDGEGETNTGALAARPTIEQHMLYTRFSRPLDFSGDGQVEALEKALLPKVYTEGFGALDFLGDHLRSCTRENASQGSAIANLTISTRGTTKFLRWDAPNIFNALCTSAVQPQQLYLEMEAIYTPKPSI